MQILAVRKSVKIRDKAPLKGTEKPLRTRKKSPGRGGGGGGGRVKIEEGKDRTNKTK